MILRHFHTYLLLLIILVFCLSACTPTTTETIVVTEVIDIAGLDIVVTRIIESEATPIPTELPPEPVNRPVELDIAYVGELPNLNPQTAVTKSGQDMMESLFVGLTNFNNQTNFVEPELATRWEASGDGRVWTFYLRDDLPWIQPVSPPNNPIEPWLVEELRPVVADDIVFALQRACSQETANGDVFLLFIIEGCEPLFRIPDASDELVAELGVRALDETAVEFRLRQPASYFLTLTTLPVFRPIPRDLVTEYDDEWLNVVGEFAGGWQTPENIITNGPFFPSPNIFSLDEIILFRNPLWPLSPTPLANVDNINITFADDDAAMYELWRDKLLDKSVLPIDVRQDFLDRTPNKAKLVTNQTVFYLGFNLEDGVFSEAETRRAFATAVDREQLVTDMFAGRAQPLRHFTPPGVFGAPPVAEVGLGYQPDYARQQMRDSSNQNCKLMPPITFLVSTADLSLLQAEILRNMWLKEMACEESQIIIEQVEFGNLLAATAPDATNRPDLWELAWPAYYPDAHNILFDLFHCIEGENRQNRTCEEADNLLKQAGVTPNPEERRALYRTVENLFFGGDGQYPVIPLYVRGEYEIVQSWLTYTPALSGGEQFNTYIVDEELKRLERSRG